MAKTDELVPEDYLVYLQKHIPGFAAESHAHQWALARMAWHGSHKVRRHSHFEGAMSFSYQELAASFGRSGFKAVNDRVKFFRLSSNYSMLDGYTKGYWLSDLVATVHANYMRRYWKTLTELLWVRGNKLVPAKSLPDAVASTDTNGKAVSTAMWKGAKSLNLVPVDIDSLTSLRKWLATVLDLYESGATPAQEDLLLGPYPDREHVARLHEATVKILRHATTNLAGRGQINQRYAIAPSGRLYARGVSLQAAHTLIKQAALHGLWEYDFSNCHFALVSQMSAQAGYRCKAIEHYMANKQATREAISKAAGITIDQVKEALLATMYGARESTREKDAIPEAIGKEAALRLYAVPEFQRLKADITTARALILKNWKQRTANGRLANACGKAIPAKAPATQRLAHLVQGAEAKALMVAVNMHPDHIVLLQHDGFTSTTRLDPRAIEQAVFQELGYRLELEEERLQIDPGAQFLKSRSKSEIARKANAGAGFSPSHAS